MKVHDKNRKGMILIFVIVIFAMVEMYMLILAGCTNTFIFQSDRDYLNACKQNLIASGLNWTKQNAALLNAKKAIELNTNEMNIKDSALKIEFIKNDKNEALIKINSSCSRGRQTITSEEKFIFKIN